MRPSLIVLAVSMGLLCGAGPLAEAQPQSEEDEDAAEEMMEDESQDADASTEESEEATEESEEVTEESEEATEESEEATEESEEAGEESEEASEEPEEEEEEEEATEAEGSDAAESAVEAPADSDTPAAAPAESEQERQTREARERREQEERAQAEGYERKLKEDPCFAAQEASKKGQAQYAVQFRQTGAFPAKFSIEWDSVCPGQPKFSQSWKDQFAGSQQTISVHHDAVNIRILATHATGNVFSPTTTLVDRTMPKLDRNLCFELSGQLLVSKVSDCQ